MNKDNPLILKAFSLPDVRISIQILWAFSFAVLMALGAQLEIPNQPVPFTLQTFFVFMAGALLGKRSGALSMGIYLILGIAGFPVFSGGAFGLAKIVGPTGGYLLSFPIAAYVIGFLVGRRKEYWWILISVIAGALIIFSLGTIQLHFAYLHNWTLAVKSGFLIFSWWDGIKIIGAATISYSYLRRWKIHE